MTIKFSETQEQINWLNRKISLNYKLKNSTIPHVKSIFRGYVYLCDFGVGVGSEIQKQDRPCVVLQNRQANAHSSIAIVAPITHTGKSINTIVPIETYFDNDNNKILDGFVNLSQITTVSKIRLGKKIVQLKKEDIKKIDEAIARSLDIFKHYDKLKNQLDRKIKFIDELKEKRNKYQDELDELLKLLEVKNLEEAKEKLSNFQKQTT